MNHKQGKDQWKTMDNANEIKSHAVGQKPVGELGEAKAWLLQQQSILLDF